MSGFSSLSRSARVGLILFPLLFLFSISGFIFVARSRQLCCLRRTERQEEDHQRAETFWGRLSAANRQRIEKEDLAELGAAKDTANDVTIDRGTQESILPRK